MLNHCQIIGRLGADPEMRYTAGGTAVTNMSVATSRNYKNQQGEKVEETEWFNVVLWNRQAEVAAQYLQKGRMVYIAGRLQTRSWDDQQSGQKRYKTELVAENLVFLPDGSSQSGGGSRRQQGGGSGSGSSGDQWATEGDLNPDDLPF